ncbi:MAG: PilZ domain-containing protein [Spirochaetes bacterium]|nr:PilZ domain-containing protein [Spirochaetota bacterium]
MNYHVLINSRMTSRNSLNILGKMEVFNQESQFEEEIYLINLSLKGLQIVFSNDFLLHYLLDKKNQQQSEIHISFQYNDQDYQFSYKVHWIRIYNLGEKDFYSLVGLNFLDKNEQTKAKLVDLLVSITMEKGFDLKNQLGLFSCN